MKRLLAYFSTGFWGVALGGALSVAAANLPSGWEREQPFTVNTNGLVKINLPVETLDAARPGLEDARLYDDAGVEIPYVVEHPFPVPRRELRVKSFQSSLNAATTILTMETGVAQPADEIVLETPSAGFIKAVEVEGSVDGKNWRSIAQGRPIFRQPAGVGNLRIAFPAGSWQWLRLTVDDHRSRPVPFTGALIRQAGGEAAPTDWIATRIKERDENPGETRLALDLGAANMNLAAVEIQTGEPLFTRRVTVAVPRISEEAVREQRIGEGMIYRVAVEGQPASGNLSVPLETVAGSRELVLLIINGNSPPLPITGARVERRPVYLAFLSRAPGRYHLLTGNHACAAPRYDLAALGIDLKSVAVLPVKLPFPSENPDYRAPEVLPRLDSTGAALDISEWRFRKPVKITEPGVQQIELDLDVLARSEQGFAGLRLLRGTNQVPYVIENTSISRPLTPAVSTTNDAKNPRLSRWIIKLPRAGLPLTRLSCVTRTALFQRQISLYAELADNRGDIFRQTLGGGSWQQTPERTAKDFSLMLNGTAGSDTLFLETENGDNPPIELENFTAFYPVTRLLFKATAGDEIYLCYGNRRVPPPHYDLSLVADQLLGADKKTASLAAEERLKKTAWGEGQVSGNGGALFWGVLALVVVALLVVMSRLLPKPELPSK